METSWNIMNSIIWKMYFRNLCGILVFAIILCRPQRVLQQRNLANKDGPVLLRPHSSTLTWNILWMEEPGRLQSMGSLRVRYDWATSLSLFMHWRRNWQPTPCSCLENPRDGGPWWAAIYGVTQSQTRLKRLSCSSSNIFILMLRDSYGSLWPKAEFLKFALY